MLECSCQYCLLLCNSVYCRHCGVYCSDRIFPQKTGEVCGSLNHAPIEAASVRGDLFLCFYGSIHIRRSHTIGRQGVPELHKYGKIDFFEEVLRLLRIKEHLTAQAKLILCCDFFSISARLQPIGNADSAAAETTNALPANPDNLAAMDLFDTFHFNHFFLLLVLL